MIDHPSSQITNSSLNFCRNDKPNPIAKAGIAVGADRIFLETHPNPSEAKSDGENMLPINRLEDLLNKLVKIRKSLN